VKTGDTGFAVDISAIRMAEMPAPVIRDFSVDKCSFMKLHCEYEERGPSGFEEPVERVRSRSPIRRGRVGNWSRRSSRRAHSARTGSWWERRAVGAGGTRKARPVDVGCFKQRGGVSKAPAAPEAKSRCWAPRSGAWRTV